MKKLMAKKNSGFTLVEIIVVLVILAILAAAMIPTMLGYVQEARGKSHADSARVVYNAAQTIATEMAALGADNATIETFINDGLDGTISEANKTANSTYATMAQRILALIGKDIQGALNAEGGKIYVDMGTTDGSVGTIYYQSGSEDADYLVTLIAGGTTTVATVEDSAGVLTGEGAVAMVAIPAVA